MVTSLSEYLMSQEEFTFEEAGCEFSSASGHSCDWTQVVKETNKLGWDYLVGRKRVTTMDRISKIGTREDRQSIESGRMDHMLNC